MTSRCRICEVKQVS